MALPVTFGTETAATGGQLDQNFAAVGDLGSIPCLVAGTNTITLTQQVNTPTISAYSNYLRFSGIVAVTNTGAVTAQVGALAALPVYKDTTTGPTALGSGDLRAGNAVVFTYDSALNSGGGGFHIQVPSAGGGTGTVTSVATNNGLTGGPITGSGTVGLATVTNLSLLANISGITAIPSANTLSAILDAVFGTTQGSVLYRNATIWTVLGPGTNGQKLTSGGAGANLSWT